MNLKQLSTNKIENLMIFMYSNLKFVSLPKLKFMHFYLFLKMEGCKCAMQLQRKFKTWDWFEIYNSNANVYKGSTPTYSISKKRKCNVPEMQRNFFTFLKKNKSPFPGMGGEDGQMSLNGKFHYFFLVLKPPLSQNIQVKYKKTRSRTKTQSKGSLINFFSENESPTMVN